MAEASHRTLVFSRRRYRGDGSTGITAGGHTAHWAIGAPSNTGRNKQLRWRDFRGALHHFCFHRLKVIPWKGIAFPFFLIKEVEVFNAGGSTNFATRFDFMPEIFLSTHKLPRFAAADFSHVIADTKPE